MRLGYANSLYPEPLEATCARAAACGFDGVELVMDDAILSEPERVRALLHRYDLELAAGVALMSKDREIIHPEPRVREAGVAFLTAAVEVVATLGGAVLTFPPAAEGRFTPWATDEQERSWCVEGIRAAQEVGDQRGVRVAIEPVCRFETYYVNRAMQAFSLAEEVGPGCGIVLDVFHMYLEELDPFEAIEAASGRLINFHVAEHNRLSPGLGVVRWIDFVKVLKDVQYDGYVTLEFAAPDVWPASVGSSDPYTAAVRNAAELLRGCY